MNRKTLFTVATAVIAVLGAASAIADDAPNGRLTRAEVRAAAIEARNKKAGEIVGPSTSTLTRAQVIAETLEAIRIGAVNFSSDYGPQSGPTEAQLELIRLAGLKALSMGMASR